MIYEFIPGWLAVTNQVLREFLRIFYCRFVGCECDDYAALLLLNRSRNCTTREAIRDIRHENHCAVINAASATIQGVCAILGRHRPRITDRVTYCDASICNFIGWEVVSVMSISEVPLRIAGTNNERECDEAAIYRQCLPLGGAKILELGCGTAVHTVAIASYEPSASITAYEIDAIQHRKNELLASSNISFKFGGAQAIAEPDGTFDVVMMFKSLHHVPLDDLDLAFAEISRVLKPGGLLYLSEPVFAGPFNEILRLFHDEEKVRRAAFEATCRAVSSGQFSSAEEIFFNSLVRFEDFADFEYKVINVTHSDHQLDVDLHNLVKKRFEQSQTQDGARFSAPMRVNVLKKQS